MHKLEDADKNSNVIADLIRYLSTNVDALFFFKINDY